MECIDWEEEERTAPSACSPPLLRAQLERRGGSLPRREELDELRLIDGAVVVSIHLRQNGLFLSFPYVCPEPVLVKSAFLHINGSKSPFFHRLVDALEGLALL